MAAIYLVHCNKKVALTELSARQAREATIEAAIAVRFHGVFRSGRCAPTTGALRLLDGVLLFFVFC